MLTIFASALISFVLTICTVGCLKTSLTVALAIPLCFWNAYAGAVIYLATMIYSKALLNKQSQLNGLLLKNQEVLLRKLENEVRFKNEMSARVLHMTKRIRERGNSDG